MALYELHERPELERPVLVLALEGWVDAGLGMGQAVGVLSQGGSARPVATFDIDQLLDLRARRPTMTLADGLLADLRWPTTELLASTDLDGHDTLVLAGMEPDHRWRQFCAEVLALATELGVELIATIGAYPAAVPHTRPTRLTITSNNADRLVPALTVQGALELPSGISSAIEWEASQAGIDSVGIWAQVPHYVAAMHYPAASAAILDGLAPHAGRRFDTGRLRAAGESTRSRIDELVAQSEEHQQIVAELEAHYDRPSVITELPTGDDLAAELQQFLRDLGN